MYMYNVSVVKFWLTLALPIIYCTCKLGGGGDEFKVNLTTCITGGIKLIAIFTNFMSGSYVGSIFVKNYFVIELKTSMVFLDIRYTYDWEWMNS
jgi:hypothetical protein